MTDILNVTVADGKYTYVMRADGSTTALRYGEAWPAFENQSPDNLHFALAAEVQDLRDAQAELLDALVLTRDDWGPSSAAKARAQALLSKYAHRMADRRPDGRPVAKGEMAGSP